MSVLVKGMEMPKNCFRCDIRRSCDLAWYLDPDNRPDNCPLVEVPVPHGRLIDADALADKWIWGNTDRTRQVECIELHDLEASPTVIEAEGE